MNRNRFSAVATISVPTLGIKGKKISEEERYLETIEPAPATKAGEPLGEIEVEVTAELAEKLKEGWPMTVSREEKRSGDIPVPQDGGEPPSNSQKHEETARPHTQEPKSAPSAACNDTTNEEDKPTPPEAHAHRDRNAPAPPAERSGDIPVPQDGGEPPSNSQKHEETARPHTQDPKSAPSAPCNNTTSKEDKPTPPVAHAHRDRNVPAPSAERSGDIPVPQDGGEPPSNSQKHEETARPHTQEPKSAPSAACNDTTNEEDKSTPPEAHTHRDRNVPAPFAEPSLFRSRSFAALIDISVACSFFVLGLLLFPDPPRVIPFVLGFLYLLTKDSLGVLNGQSIGKKILRLRAVHNDQRSLTGNYKSGFKRNLSWLMAPVEFAVLYVREDEPTKGTRLGDDWAKTRVIEEEKARPRKSKWLP